MTQLWDCTTERGKETLAKLYKQLTGREFKQPIRDRRAIQCEPKLESLGEIKEIMEQNRGVWHE